MFSCSDVWVGLILGQTDYFFFMVRGYMYVSLDYFKFKCCFIA